MSVAKGKRLGGPPPTISTLDEPTEPEITQPGRPRPEPPAQPAAQESGQALVPTSETAPAVPPLAHPIVDVGVPQQQPAARPRAEDLVRRRTGDIQREQINAMTPVVLDLARRMGYYKLDHGIELRDQVALAVDGWLSSQGY